MPAVAAVKKNDVPVNACIRTMLSFLTRLFCPHPHFILRQRHCLALRSFIHSYILAFRGSCTFLPAGKFCSNASKSAPPSFNELLSRLCSSRKCNDCNVTVTQSCHYTECPEYKTVPTNCRSSSVAKILVWTSHRLCTSMGWALC